MGSVAVVHVLSCSVTSEIELASFALQDGFLAILRITREALEASLDSRVRIGKGNLIFFFCRLTISGDGIRWYHGEISEWPTAGMRAVFDTWSVLVISLTFISNHPASACRLIKGNFSLQWCQVEKVGENLEILINDKMHKMTGTRNKEEKRPSPWTWHSSTKRVSYSFYWNIIFPWESPPFLSKIIEGR